MEMPSVRPMNPMTPPSKPRADPVTPSTCDTTPILPEQACNQWATPPVPLCNQWATPPVSVGGESCLDFLLDVYPDSLPKYKVRDDVAANLMPGLPEFPKNDATVDPISMILDIPPQTSSSMLWCTPPVPSKAPSTPPRSRRQDTYDSPPPAPKSRRPPRLGQAISENDLVEVVEILARQPRLATMQFPDGTDEFPLERAVRLNCDPIIIQVLQDNGAQAVEREPNTPRRSQRQGARDSPPPAPKPSKPTLGQAIKENDLVEVVEMLAKRPRLATMPLPDGPAEFPLQRALRLSCDPIIIQVIIDNGAFLGNLQQHDHMHHIPFPVF